MIRFLISKDKTQKGSFNNFHDSLNSSNRKKGFVFLQGKDCRLQLKDVLNMKRS